jgi:SAM-dependent methyltransferase
MNEREDAFGRALLDWAEGCRSGGVVLERDDGYVFVEHGSEFYDAPFRRWDVHERRALRFARGRVLDVGCGSGRVALELQQRGREVVAIDVSPRAIEAARRRGVDDARVLAFEDLGAADGRFDTVVLFGNNLGLLSGPAKARRVLRRFGELTTARGRILGGGMAEDAGGDPEHLAYRERNERLGRPAGQARLRVRYRGSTSPWFTWWFASRTQLEDCTRGTGWHVTRYIDGTNDRFVAVFEKDDAAVLQADE